jgi:hypothetical protein
MLRNTPLASPAVFASKRLPDHAVDTEIIFVEFPQPEKLHNRCLLLAPTGEPGNESWVSCHGACVKVSRGANYQRKEHIQERM